MRGQKVALILLAASLGGCSYEYQLEAVLLNEQVIFIVDPSSRSVPSCFRQVEVSGLSGRISEWRDSVDYKDACSNKFPIVYGAKLNGRPQADWPTINAKPLQRGVVYEVNTTTGATGYGVGRFSIDENGRIINVKVH